MAACRGTLKTVLRGTARRLEEGGGLADASESTPDERGGRARKTGDCAHPSLSEDCGADVERKFEVCWMCRFYSHDTDPTGTEKE
mmetsp:Transcript_28497/g.67520  ORF Transcript_28497/g.67520 Transcript_28497/m.67520 type:complete len:85 (+) Transcript_28497:955-1209(+)